jgi:hypothetical protein
LAKPPRQTLKTFFAAQRALVSPQELKLLRLYEPPDCPGRVFLKSGFGVRAPQKTFFAATCPVLFTGLGGSQLQICAGLSDFEKTLIALAFVLTLTPERYIISCQQPGH